MERKFTFEVGDYYHVYNRGVEKRQIFLNRNDSDRFVRNMFLFNSDRSIHNRDVMGRPYENIPRGDRRVSIGAYCLMPNHFHLFLREIRPGGISTFLSKLLTGYSMYFNKKYKRTGALFEGTYRAKYVDNDDYMKYLFAYIHLNPLKLIEPGWKEDGIQNEQGTHEYLSRYRYSSFHEYVGKEREEGAIVSKEDFSGLYAESGNLQTLLSHGMLFDSEEEASLSGSESKYDLATSCIPQTSRITDEVRDEDVDIVL